MAYAGMTTVLAAVAATLVSGTASAHGLHAETSSFATGAMHPFLGLDHVLAMVAVGLWAGQLGGSSRLFVPVGFVVAMIGGAVLAIAGAAIPVAEMGILASVILLGLLVAARVKASVFAGVAIVAAFALCHGYAHGIEVPAGGSFLAYGAGFVAATAALHAIGVALSVVLTSRQAATRVAGAATAAAGVLLALT